MPTRRVLKSVLHGFLGTYTSRYSDYDGYWLFGFLVGELGAIDLDLLTCTVNGATNTVDLATQLAIARFSEQLVKSGLEREKVLNARLRIATTRYLHARHQWPSKQRIQCSIFCYRDDRRRQELSA